MGGYSVLALFAFKYSITTQSFPQFVDNVNSDRG